MHRETNICSALEIAVIPESDSAYEAISVGNFELSLEIAWAPTVGHMAKTDSATATKVTALKM